MNTTVNERIKHLRNELNLSQSDLANRLGMSATGVWKMETDGAKPRTSTLISIAKEFNVNQDWLISGSGEMFNSSPGVETSASKTFSEKTIESMERHIETLERNNRALIDTLQKLMSKVEVNFLEGIAEMAGITNCNSCNTVRVAA
jgi:transcriptional regulator with XRE-family HTH domain